MSFPQICGSGKNGAKPKLKQSSITKDSFEAEDFFDFAVIDRGFILYKNRRWCIFERNPSYPLGMSSIKIEIAEEKDLHSMQKLFTSTIESVCSADYTPAQIEVWTSSVENQERWQKMVEDQYVLLAKKGDKLLGFATLANGDYVDFFYVHKDHQGQGVAKLLYKKIEKEAMDKGASELSSDVSITARAFFERQGFYVVKEQKIEKKGVILTNFKMQKELLQRML